MRHLHRHATLCDGRNEWQQCLLSWSATRARHASQASSDTLDCTGSRDTLSVIHRKNDACRDGLERKINTWTRGAQRLAAWSDRAHATKAVWNHSTAGIVASVGTLTQLKMYKIFRVSNLQKGTLMMIEYVTLDDWHSSFAVFLTECSRCCLFDWQALGLHSSCLCLE